MSFRTVQLSVLSLLALSILPLTAAAVEVTLEPAAPETGELIEVFLAGETARYPTCATLEVDDLEQPSPHRFRVSLRPDRQGGPSCDFRAAEDDAPALALGPLPGGSYTLEVVLGAETTARLDFTVTGEESFFRHEVGVTPLPWSDPNLFLVSASGTFRQSPMAVPGGLEVSHNLIHVNVGIYDGGPAAVGPWSSQAAVGPLPEGFYTVVVHLRNARDDNPAPFHVIAGSHPLRVAAGAPPSGCEPSPTALCLDANRFRVTAGWNSGSGGSGDAGAVPLSPESGGFWFFRRDNPELVVKVLDACVPFGHHWVFAAGLTNVGVDLRVVDTATGATWSHHTEPREGFEPVRDTAAFPCQ